MGKKSNTATKIDTESSRSGPSLPWVPLAYDLVGEDVVADFFSEQSIPDEEIPGLVAKCPPGSDWRDWYLIGEAWGAEHGKPPGIRPQGLPESPPEPPAYDSPARLRDFLQRHREGLNIAAKDDAWSAFMGRLAVREAVRCLRQMGAAEVPKISPKLDTIDSIQRAIDRLIEWCESQKSRKTETQAKGKGGRAADPKVQARNRRILEMYKDGKSVNDVTERFGITPVLARRIKSDGGLGSRKGAKKPQS